MPIFFGKISVRLCEKAGWQLRPGSRQAWLKNSHISSPARFGRLKDGCVRMRIALTMRDVAYEYTEKWYKVATASSPVFKSHETPKENSPQLWQTIQRRQQCQNCLQSYSKNQYLLRNIRSLQPFSWHQEPLCLVIEGQVRYKASIHLLGVETYLQTSWSLSFSHSSCANPFQLFCHHRSVQPGLWCQHMRLLRFFLRFIRCWSLRKNGFSFEVL